MNAKTAQQKIKALLELGEYHYSISNQHIYLKSIDSAFYYAQRAASLSEAINYKIGIGESYLLSSKIYINTGAANKAIQFAQQAVDLFSKLKDGNNIARSYMALVKARGTQEDISVSISLAQKAYTLYEHSGKKLEQANALVEIAYLKMGLGNMEAAKTNFKYSLALYRECNYKKTQRVYSLLGMAYLQMGAYKESLENSLQAVKLLESNNDTSVSAAEIYNYVAITYNQLQDIKRSNEYFQRAYRISARFNETELNTMILTNIIQTFINLNKDKEAILYLKKLEKDIDKMDEPSRILLISRALRVYTEVSDFKSAKKYNDEAIKKLKEQQSGNNTNLILYPSIIRYLIKSAQYSKARNYVANYKKISEKNKDKKRLQEIHMTLFQLDSIESKFLSAIQEYKLQQTYKDSLFSQEKNKQIAELQIKFETEKKDKDLVLKEQQNKLLRKQGELQKTKLSKANLLKNIGFGSMALFLLIIALLFAGYRLKHKTNRILESQKGEINQKNVALQKLVVEKEWLLKEIHHRVKNNLQMVMSLLKVQSHHLKDPAVISALKESQNRIHSMSLIHKKLYQSENVMSVNMSVYIQELVEYFQSTFDMDRRIQFSLDLEAIDLDTSQAVPLGLILNEAITNSIKHAFAGKESGLISVSFKCSGQDHIRMSIMDNGVGISDDFEDLGFKSLGMKLIQGFSTDLDAKLLIKNESGLLIDIEFPYNQ
ncbi:tetratricopeptide repeat-containing sensor histidine kinase [Pedobacter alluvionis]|uniref:tetratricopeptide repeat-containing sensor histidine kinase n=1 Tax=Pedobacter alluvionis TaxID=475253 RepID=UPI00141BBF93|nr:histidine kinase dimerization/phosphoacceptor domain -containing protein [Pedobacter alluvionis]